MVSRVDLFSLAGGAIKQQQRGSIETDEKRITSLMPNAWDKGGIAVKDDQIFVVGGDIWHAAIHDTPNAAAVYNIKYDCWQMLPTLNHTRLYGPSVFIFENHLYASGGDWNEQTMEYLDLTNVEAGWQIHDVKLPFSLPFTATVMVKNRVFMYGGSVQNNDISELISWAPGEEKWTVLRNRTVARFEHCLVSDGHDTLWSIGGCAGCGMDKYTISSNTWAPVNGTPEALGEQDSHMCTYHNGYIYIRVYPTYPDEGTFFIYNVAKNTWTNETTKISDYHFIDHPMWASIPLQS